MPSNILIIYEGGKTEKAFINHHFKAVGKADAYTPFCYGCNIYNLYDRLVQNSYGEDLSTVDLPTLLKRGSPIPSQADKSKLDGAFTDIFLVFDLDIHDTVHSPKRKLEILAKMAKIYTDSSDNGLLLVNSPMSESFRDYRIENDGSFQLNPSIEIGESGSYKSLVDKRGNNRGLSKYGLCDFARISNMTLDSIANLLSVQRKDLKADFSFQQKLVSDSIDLLHQGTIPIYNEMSLIPFAIFGERIL